jgi:hypothetical protein
VVKDAALEEVKELYNGTAKVVSKEDAEGVFVELAAAEYEWTPDVHKLELEEEAEKKLAALLVGGLILGGYAQTIDGEHVIQATRSSLFLKVALGKRRTGPSLDESLFADLKKLSNLKCEDLDWMLRSFRI